MEKAQPRVLVLEARPRVLVVEEMVTAKARQGEGFEEVLLWGLWWEEEEWRPKFVKREGKKERGEVVFG